MENCVACQNPLTLAIEPDEEDEHVAASASHGHPQTVPDSVQLACGCTFHWECLLDAYSTDNCPNCAKTVSSTSNNGAQQILCNLNNEGGFQEALDIMLLLEEALYFRMYPEKRKCRAFVEFAAEGDAISMVDLLKENASGNNDALEQGPCVANDEILIYQDSMSGMGTALHAAVANNNEAVAWLMLWLASNLDGSCFPREMVETLHELEFSRPDMANKVDIRRLQDDNGMTAEQHATRIGGLWDVWISNGWLRP